MMRFVKNDKELALVVAHEMAHAYLGHIAYARAKQVLEAALGLATDVFAPGAGRAAVFLSELATKKFDRDREREADLLGLIWAHRSGFDVSAAKDLWRRMAIDTGKRRERVFLLPPKLRGTISFHREDCGDAEGRCRSAEEFCLRSAERSRLVSAERMGLAEVIFSRTVAHARDHESSSRVHRPSISEGEPAARYSIDDPHAGRKKNRQSERNPDQGNDQHHADHTPQDRKPKSPNLPAEMRFEISTARLFSF